MFLQPREKRLCGEEAIWDGDGGNNVFSDEN